MSLHACPGDSGRKEDVGFSACLFALLSQGIPLHGRWQHFTCFTWQKDLGLCSSLTTALLSALL